MNKSNEYSLGKIIDLDWRVDTNKCVGCGECAEICPVSVFTISPPPCQVACPLNQDVAGYLNCIKQGKFDEALTLICKSNPFPGITSRVCTHPCEDACTRNKFGGSISIKALKRCAAEYGKISQKHIIKNNKNKVAIIGSGPAGLMAAHDLAIAGYQVTVIESSPMAGGMLSHSIPSFRLPRQVLQDEIMQIHDLGVEFKLNTRIGPEFPLNELFRLGYKAVLLATGAHQSRDLNIPGENKVKGIIDALAFFKTINLDLNQKITGKKALVIGGGNAAVDAARILVRLGCQQVKIIYRRSIEEMPAIKSEIFEADREGVDICCLIAPTRIVGEEAGVVTLECVRTQLGKPDETGRKMPVPVKGSQFLISADLVISAIGQQPDLSFLSKNEKLTLCKNYLIMADPNTKATKLKGVFAAGDNLTGPATVIGALASGRIAATSIVKYLRGEKLKTKSRNKPDDNGGNRIWWNNPNSDEPQTVPKLLVKERLTNFKEIENTLTIPSAIKEAERCLECAIFSNMDLMSCCQTSCRSCDLYCWQSAIKAYRM